MIASRPLDVSPGRGRRLALIVVACAFGVAQASAEPREEDGRRDVSASHRAEKKTRARPRARHEAAADVAAAGDVAPEQRPGVQRRICIIDRALVDQQAAVSVASNKRLAELRTDAQTQVDARKKTVETQLRDVDEDIRLHPGDAALKQKRLDATLQMQAVVDQAGLYSREYEATRQSISGQLRSATGPIIERVAAEGSCGIVLSSETVINAGEAVDITQSVVGQMNAQLQFKPFALVDLSGR